MIFLSTSRRFISHLQAPSVAYKIVILLNNRLKQICSSSLLLIRSYYCVIINLSIRCGIAHTTAYIALDFVEGGAHSLLLKNPLMLKPYLYRFPEPSIQWMTPIDAAEI